MKSELETALKTLDGNFYNRISTRLPFRFRISSLQTLLNLGANADTVKRESSSVTILEELFKEFNRTESNSTVCEILSMLVYVNPDVNIHPRAVPNGINRENGSRHKMQHEVPG